MDTKIESKIKFYRLRKKSETQRRKDRIANLILLVGLAGALLFYQNENGSFIPAKQNVAGVENNLPQIAPQKEIMTDGAMASGKQNRKFYLTGQYSLEQFLAKKRIESIVGDQPMKEMIAALSQRDVMTASYLVAIAKKESNLGKISPQKEGETCYNYWGYRGPENTTKSGYSCFSSPEEAVAVVGDRIHYLAKVGERETAAEMSVWKCGYDCSWDNPAAVQKWIQDVGFYYNKINGEAGDGGQI